jgi:hypothetical protein
MQRYGDWNSKNRALWEETQRLGGNKYREIYQRIKNNMEKKCTCGDTETQHYENTDKCVVCGCKEFEEVDPVHAFFTAPEEVKRPVYERALQGAQKDQEQTTNTELRQEIIKTLKAVQDYCNR